MSQIQRKLQAIFINASTTTTTDYCLLGDDLEELSTELNPNVDTKRNILGESKTKIDGYEPQDSIAPYYADDGSTLFIRLQDIVDRRLTLDDLKTTVIEVHLWELISGTTYIAYREDAIIEVTSYGGDTTGYQIPFNIHRTSNRVKGTFDIETKVFTPATGILGTLQFEVVAGTAAMKTKVTDVIGEGSGALKYKIAPSMNMPSYGESDTNYIALTLNTDLACTAMTNKIIVVETSGGKVVAASAIKKVVCTA
ncbi:MAG: hypothetical protein RSF40_07395 [Oscillospiraceae bacterium]